MKASSLHFSLSENSSDAIVNFDFEPDLLFVFADPEFFKIPTLINQIQDLYKNSVISGCSSAGQMVDSSYTLGYCTVTAVQFDKTTLVQHSVEIPSVHESYKMGKELMRKFEFEGLKHILLFSEGMFINGDELIRGVVGELPEGVTVTGGLAGDNEHFKTTYVIDALGGFSTQAVSAIGFYGDSLKVSFAAVGGWDSFGIEREVTKAEGNIVFEIDGKPALELYKEYLGKEKSRELPGSALQFPISVRFTSNDEPVIRTHHILDEEDKSITFSGNVYQGSKVRLMKANVDRLIDGAVTSAKNSKKDLGEHAIDFALIINCIGRKLVLKQYVDDEMEETLAVLGDNVPFSGFYSYGEIAPTAKYTNCQLHNQTMTITLFSEN